MDEKKARRIAKQTYAKMILDGIMPNKKEVVLKMEADVFDAVMEAMEEEQ